MIGIICAELQELNEVIKLMENITREKIATFNFIIGYISEIKCVVALSGVGKVHAAMCTQTLIISYTPDLILNVGVAGAIDSNIKIGDIVVATSVIQHDFDVSAFPHRKKGEIVGLDLVNIPCTTYIIDKIIRCLSDIKNSNVHKGNILTGDQFINSKKRLLTLQNHFNGIACDMESASIGQVCYINNVAFGIVRAISDNASNDSNIDFDLFIESSSKNAAKILLEFIKLYRD